MSVLVRFLLVDVRAMPSVVNPFAYLMSFFLDAPIRDIGSMIGVTINTVVRRVILKFDATVLETLREVQLDQIEISKHEHITLADLLADGTPVSSLLTSFLNFTGNLGVQTTTSDNSINDRLFDSPRSGFRRMYACSLICYSSYH